MEFLVHRVISQGKPNTFTEAKLPSHLSKTDQITSRTWGPHTLLKIASGPTQAIFAHANGAMR